MWSPDGSRIVFNSGRAGTLDLYQTASSGTGSDELLLKSDDTKWPNDWSSDGRFISFGGFNPKTQLDAWILPLDGGRKPFPIVQTQFFEGWTTFSPDRRWVAYTSDKSGRNEVYVQPFNPASGATGRALNGNAK